MKPSTIRLESPVDRIDDKGDFVEVKSAKGAFKCKRVIASLPTTLYKTVEFSPPLSEAKMQLANSTIHGYTSKVILVYARPWWREAGLCGMSQCLDGLVAVTRDVSNDVRQHWALLCFLVGEPGRSWAKKMPKERRSLVLEHLDKVFRPLADVLPPLDMIEQDWSNEKWSQGCPCPAMPPGLLSAAGHALQERHGNVHFIGTETATIWRGYMDGAVRSGERGASEVLASLKDGVD